MTVTLFPVEKHPPHPDIAHTAPADMHTIRPSANEHRSLSARGACLTGPVAGRILEASGRNRQAGRTDGMSLAGQRAADGP